MLNSSESSIEELKGRFLSSIEDRCKLYANILDQLGDDENVFLYPYDYRDASAGVSGFIYYAETIKFAQDNIFEILKLLNSYELELGTIKKPTEDEDLYYNWLAWFALESMINDLLNFLEDV